MHALWVSALVLSLSSLTGCGPELARTQSASSRHFPRRAGSGDDWSCPNREGGYTFIVDSFVRPVFDESLLVETLSELDRSSPVHVRIDLNGNVIEQIHSISKILGSMSVVVQPPHEMPDTAWSDLLITLKKSNHIDHLVIDTTFLFPGEISSKTLTASKYFNISLFVPLGLLTTVEPLLVSGTPVLYSAQHFWVPSVQTYSDPHTNPFLRLRTQGLELANFLTSPVDEVLGSAIPAPDIALILKYPKTVTVILSLNNAGARRGCLLPHPVEGCSDEGGSTEFGGLESWDVFCDFSSVFLPGVKLGFDSWERLPVNWFL